MTTNGCKGAADQTPCARCASGPTLTWPLIQSLSFLWPFPSPLLFLNAAVELVGALAPPHGRPPL